jgi:cell division protease FtsH
LGREIASDRDFSDETAAAIDEEVRNLVDRAYTRAKEVLVNNRYILDRLADMLVEKETVDAEELQDLLANNDVRMASLA